MSELKSSGKSFEISKWEVHEAWETVRANKGAAGVDGCCIEDFEKDLKNNLHKVWNRMSSGSYFPPPVLAVEPWPTSGGGVSISDAARARHLNSLTPGPRHCLTPRSRRGRRCD